MPLARKVPRAEYPQYTRCVEYDLLLHLVPGAVQNIMYFPKKYTCPVQYTYPVQKIKIKLAMSKEPLKEFFKKQNKIGFVLFHQNIS